MTLDLTEVQQQMLRECVRYCRRREAGRAGAAWGKSVNQYPTGRLHGRPELQQEREKLECEHLEHLNRGQALAVLLAKLDQAIATKGVPQAQWVWQGHAGHFVCADDCRFRMATRVGSWLVSTVGDFYSQDDEHPRCLTTNPKSLFETYVFNAGATLNCGCTEPGSLTPVECHYYAAAGDAHTGHLALCRKYALIAAKEDDGHEEHDDEET